MQYSIELNLIFSILHNRVNMKFNTIVQNDKITFYDILLLFFVTYLSYYDNFTDVPKNALLKPFYFSLYTTLFYYLVPSVFFKITFSINITSCIIAIDRIQGRN
jgi:hypothetical protein